MATDEPTVVPDRPPSTARLLPWHDTDGGAYSTAGLPTPTPADAQHMPIYSDGRRLFVGVDQGADKAGSLPTVGRRGETEIRLGSLSDGEGSAAVEVYLAEAAQSSVSYDSPLELRIIGLATEADVGRVIRAVQLVNAALPEVSKLEIGAPLPAFSLRNNVGGDGRYYDSGAERTDTIHIEFVPPREYRRGPDSAAVAYVLDDGGSYIQFNTGAASYARDNEATILLAHELIHALADFGHVSPDFATILEGTGAIHDSVQGGQRQPLSLLYPVDREALRAFYGNLAGSLGPFNLGLWESTSWHLAGRSPHTAFGVALRNRYVEPWAYGDRPATDLAHSPHLAGRATWKGVLLGFGPDQSVSGDASIAVELATLTGRADFTNLEAWNDPPLPGEAGSGMQWLDGDLGYLIAVRGNTFRETSGDAGRLTGIFVGRNHEGAAGTLERDDLVASFGAQR
ncbi:MAG: hypothetical protein OXH09_07135 [Gammaproteobacteria bacterium]|nr:hypothetical protein [Gammaproteobacteria bacterium]